MLKHTLFHSQRIWIGLAALYFLTVSSASARQQLHGHVPKAVATAPMVGEVADTEPFYLAIGLPLRNQSDLQSLIQNLYDPNSPKYHQYLTPEQFTSMFGPTPEDYQKLIDFAQANGLSIAGTSRNRLILNVNATAADIRRVFHVNLHYYQRPNGTQFYSPDTDPSVDLDLPISHVSGLNNYAIPYSNMIKNKPPLGKNTPSNFRGPNLRPSTGTGTGVEAGLYLYWGFDFRNIYVPCTTETGTGQNIALVEFDDYNASNISHYEADTGIGSPSVTRVSVGSAFSGPGSGQEEVELDIEMAMSMAPGASIYVYEDKGLNEAQNDALFDAIAFPTEGRPLCYQISSSWSWTDTGSIDMTLQYYFQEYATQGQSFFQASGDLGAYVADDPMTAVPMPASENSLMTVVGGTNLTTTGTNGTSVGNYTSETTWNDEPEIASTPNITETPAVNLVTSGGYCPTIAIPTYQVPFASSSGANASNQYRNIPDVAMVADYIQIYSNAGFGNGVQFSGGTSAASPLWAGLMALINETASNQAKGPIGFANYYLYNLASNATTYANDFHDIKDGSTNNYWGSQPVSFKSVTGYDLTTGLGSPQCNIIGDIIAPLATNTITSTPTQTRTPTITPTPTNSPTVTNTPTPPTTTTSYAYPQPASGQVMICFNSNTAQQIQINVYSFSGQLITSVTDNAQNSNQNRIPISLQGITPGVYFYVIRGSGGVMCTGKFLAVP